MKVILSRKGFDSRYGGIPSPILPDGRMISLPIVPSSDKTTFADVNVSGVDLGRIIHDLSRGAYSIDTRVHLDPDLDRTPAQRKPGWRPAFGQGGVAQSHLRLARVGQGDVFLFFGWFRQIECVDGTWQFVKSAPDLHVIFGWLEIGDVISVTTDLQRCLSLYPWASDHVHVTDSERDADLSNTLYVAAPTSKWAPKAAYGGGRFLQHDPRLILTKPGSTRSVWRLPMCFMPVHGKPPLTYHSAHRQWSSDGEYVTLHSARIGQEFVIDGDHYSGVTAWASELIANCA